MVANDHSLGGKFHRKCPVVLFFHTKKFGEVKAFLTWRKEQQLWGLLDVWAANQNEPNLSLCGRRVGPL